MKEYARWTRDIVTRSVSSIFEPDRWKNRCGNRFWISFESNFKYLEPMRRSRPIFLVSMKGSTNLFLRNNEKWKRGGGGGLTDFRYK